MKPIIFVGTASNVGKSTITAAFCRLLRQEGYQPAPFKAQNMSLNSYVTAEGLEMGRAQVVQAEAAGIPCHVDMNPVLLKPTSDQGSQVIVNGKAVGNQSAYEYFQSDNRNALFAEAMRAYERLAARYHPIVIEGAGSISELNLKARDITNMRVALHTGADTYLIADIDRGGVFGSVYGTMQLLNPEERKCIKGIIINKFRGDARLFAEGRKVLEDLTRVPVVGVLPYHDIVVEEEDSVVLEQKRRLGAKGQVNVAVVLLKRMSNFTDFDVLENDPRVNLYYTHQPTELEKADVIILPGSKNTMADLIDIRNNGAARAVTQAYRNGKVVIGICGGYQMLGQSVEDPLHIEGEVEYMPGLGLLPVRTVLEGVKTTQQREFRFRENNALCRGYEIHMGQTQVQGPDSPVSTLSDNRTDGYWLNERCWGTYLHGMLDNTTVVEAMLRTVGVQARQPSEKPFDYPAFKEKQYDRLATWLRNHLDIGYMMERWKMED